ncbi:hypothetical protein KSF_054240 [Reticulibacter mediterranei]|uniref:UDP-N-acetylmuramoyl-tripeptide--D-alanyl-D-alanine ligase n=1 Tax=Reticulibacter mediterranei TaxID=2778369 RepID=A0A8J3IU77_9CHLR|nr:Mur ligase family protein [Reticulibacter mediterranei]GHO95376.1 hypothetical protein KSF_054240 [Reticulibacter mediterranei]
MPRVFLGLEAEHRYAVLEMGAEWVGELTWLCSIVRPNWSIVTNVGSAHLKTFGSPERVAIAKSELVEALPPDGIAILNYDDPRVRAMSQKTQARVMYYGLDEKAEVRASDLQGDALHGFSFMLHYHDVHLPVQLRIPGQHGVSAALAAAAAGFLAGIAPEAISSALAALVPVKGRGEIKLGPNGSTLIDDSYKANRQSILAGIAVLHRTDLIGGGKRWAVLGDMLDLANFARDEHYATGRALVGQVDYLVAIGDQARFYVEGARDAGMSADKLFFFKADPADHDQLEAAKQDVIDFLLSNVQNNDLLLLKGSNPLGLQTMLEQF